jgi:hypothetical protein
MFNVNLIPENMNAEMFNIKPLREQIDIIKASRIGYVVEDRHTGTIIRKYKAEQGATARRFVDKKDNEYGAYRYSAIPVYPGDKYSKHF